MGKSLTSFPWHDLLMWYEKHGRHGLPWRDYSHDRKSLTYRVWISEIFLQQTQVSRVIGYFERVLQRFPNIESLAHTDYETFFPYYQGLGYYSRARNMLKTAKVIMDEYEGTFPRDRKTLSKLPGVGPYTASAILAFGYGEPYLAWDTNLEKVFARYYNGDKNTRLTVKEKEEIEADFREFCSANPVIASEAWRSSNKKNSLLFFGLLRTSQGPNGTIRAINNALMDFASLIDLKNPTNINWGNYPIKSGEFYTTRGSREVIETKKSESFPIPDASVVVILHRDHKVYYSDPSLVIPANAGIQFPKLDSPTRGVLATVTSTEGQEKYSPFLLPPALHRDTREYVKSYFREKYGLELSVRPVHKKWLSEDGKPYIAVNAQVQVGDVGQFQAFGKI